MTQSILDAALAFSEAGLSVIPVDTHKRAHYKWQRWQRERADAATIRHWFWNGANVAVVGGEVSGGLLVVDFDEPRFFEGWRKQVGELANGLPTERTPRGGYHVFLRCANPGGNQKLAFIADETETSGRKIAIETRGQGGYAVVAPSTNYILLEGSLTAIPLIPQERVDALLNAARELDECPLTRQEREARAKRKSNPHEGKSVIDAYNAAHAIDELLTRNGYRLNGSGRYIRPGGEHPSVTVKDERSFHHNSNDLLCDGYWHSAFDVFCKLEHGGDVRAAVKAAARELGLNAERSSCEKTDDAWLPTWAVMGAFDRGETGDAELFACLFADRARYDHSEKMWFLWHAHYWEPDRKNVVTSFIPNDVASQYLHAAAEIKRSGEEHADETATELCARAGGLRFRNKIASVLTLAASQPAIALAGEEWDCEPMLLGVTNGTLVLKTGELRPGQPRDYIRKIAPTEWRGLECAAPRWEQFLREIFADDTALIAFVQRLLGYGITGDTTEHVFPVLWGEGRNGKDTLLETLAYVLGTLAAPVSADVLLDSKHDPNGATPNLFALRGMRLAWVSETNEGARLNAAQVKNLTGGGTIVARPLYGRPVTFPPQYLLMLITNHKPHANADDYGLWQRLLLIPFTQAFVENPQAANEHKRDAHLLEMLKAEKSGVLSWLVRGCLDWQQHGLEPPDMVRTATSEYRQAEDTVSQFIVERCIVKPDVETKASELYSGYAEWAKQSGMTPMSATAFGTRVGKRFKKRTGHTNTYIGVGLIA